MSTLSPHFVIDATTSAALVVSDLRAELEQRIANEARHATEQAEAYASHLVAGGDPTKGFESLRYRDQLVSLRRSALAKVYELWNKQRGGKHNVPPFYAEEWRVAEALTDEIGKPVSYADLQGVYRGTSRYGGSPKDIVGAALAVEKKSDGKLVARRTKVDGKVAYLVRARRGDDPETDKYPFDSLPEE